MELAKIGILHELDDCTDDNGNVCVWSVSCGYDDNGKEHWIWIDKFDLDGCTWYEIVNSDGDNLNGKKRYSMLGKATNEAKRIASRQNELKAFTD